MDLKHRLDLATNIFNQRLADFELLKKDLNKSLDSMGHLMFTAHAELQKIRLEYEIACIESWGGIVDKRDASLEAISVWWHKNPDAMPDLNMIINNPPYKYFSRSALLAFMADCGLIFHPKWDDKRCHLGNVHLRATPSRYQMPFVLRGISAFSQVMERDENGRVRFSIDYACVRIYFENELGFGVRRIADYEGILVNPEDKQCYLTLRISMIDESYDDELIILNFPDIRSAYLHLIASRYRTKRYYRQLIKQNSSSSILSLIL
ncbi:hypothetical protein IG608_07600 [Pectobacterium sp. A113-S21-F16]|uniref:hypothetical protein n=1 Tax=Pectobacterium quasiaquaticum TaxID=2774015 RepID=UPI001873BCCF|nr:hypothetical protein [Pectobacterium quasiaquaticum]MBE5221329.1 hypothetical protein [Pectobacterium quasiaquaticum]